MVRNNIPLNVYISTEENFVKNNKLNYCRIQVSCTSKCISLILSPTAKVMCDLGFLKECSSELSRLNNSGNISIPGTVSCDSVFLPVFLNSMMLFLLISKMLQYDKREEPHAYSVTA